MLTPKNGDERAVDMTAYLAERLRAAVKSRLPRARVVVDEKGRTPVRQEVLRHFKEHQQEQGLRKLWSFHSLRHRFCSSLARHGVHVEAIMQLAGHKSIATTMRYIHATFQDRGRRDSQAGGANLPGRFCPRGRARAGVTRRVGGEGAATS